MIRIPSRIPKAIGALVIAVPLLAVVHETLLLVTALLLQQSAHSELVGNFIGAIVTDPVHAEIVGESVSGIRPLGLALPGDAGQAFHQLSPALFASPQSMLPGTWVSAVFSEESTILGLFLTRMLAECFLIVVSGLFIRWGMRDKNPIAWLKSSRARDLSVVVIGLLMMAQAIWALMRLAIFSEERNLRDTGIGFALSTVWSVPESQYLWLMDQFLPVLIPVTFIVIGLGLTWLLGRLPLRVRLKPATHESAPSQWSRVLMPFALGAMLLLAAVSGNYFGLARMRLLPLAPIQSAAVPFVAPTDPTSNASSTPVQSMGQAPDSIPTANSDSGGTSSPTPVVSILVSQSTPGMQSMTPDSNSDASRPPRFSGSTDKLSTATSASLSPSKTPPGPSAASNAAQSTAPKRCQQTVGIVMPGSIDGSTQAPSTTTIGATPDLRLLVNGRPTTLVGMNYNVNYTRLPLATKRSLHYRDFKILQNAGVNAVIGWGVYDEATLQVAQQYGIGVIMPFDLDPQGPYDNAAYDESIKTKFIAFVNRFRSYPAVLGWNPGGDELLHRMMAEQHRTPDKLQAAADFLVDLAATAHNADFNHVSIIKDARDAYLPYLEQSLKKARTHTDQPDPAGYLVYGVNIYGTPSNIASSLSTAQENIRERLHLGMLVGEYAPFGLARKERAANYSVIWDIVNGSSPNGGFAYVFGPDQPNPEAPNPYDPLRLLVNEFSLVNSDGIPVDDTLATLASRWHKVQGVNCAPGG